MKTLILIDGNSIFHRAFHAIPPTLKSPQGEIVNAVYGFSLMLLTLMNREKPTHIAVAFDMKGKTFRHEKSEEYKATRVKAPDELYMQIPRIREVVKSFQIPIYEMEGFEGDDLLGTMAMQASEMDDLSTYIVTSDKDALQLVSDRVKVITPVKGLNETFVYGPEEVVAKYALRPDQIVDMKALQGDSSDNIKGVSGIGAKTAKILLQKYETLEGIYENLNEIKGKVRENLENDRESAFLSQELAKIVTDVPRSLDLHECRTHSYDEEKIINLFTELGFNSLLSRFGQFQRHYIKEKQTEDSRQASLF